MAHPPSLRKQVTLRLRKPLERSLRAGHPWVYRDALEPFEAAPGTVARVMDRRDRFVARGWVDSGPIGVRVLLTDDRGLDERLLQARMQQALALRAQVQPPETDALRLIHGEGDRLPGVVVDRYGAYAVLRLDGSASLAWRSTLEGLLQPLLSELGIEGLLTRTGRRDEREVELAWGRRPPEVCTVYERGMRLCVNLWAGQKTGLFLDHRESRARVRGLGATRVLNLYGYTGGFSVAAGLGCAERSGTAEVITVDVAKPALQLADASWLANGLPAAAHQSIASDVPEFLASASTQAFDLVVADPPNFAPNEAARPAALHSYEALHRAVLQRLMPGAFYVAASCSSHVTREDFEQTLVAGAGKARRVLQILERTSAPFDHPRLLAFPEGDYLKVVLCRVTA